MSVREEGETVRVLVVVVVVVGVGIAHGEVVLEFIVVLLCGAVEERANLCEVLEHAQDGLVLGEAMSRNATGDVLPVGIVDTNLLPVFVQEIDVVEVINDLTSGLAGRVVHGAVSRAEDGSGGEHSPLLDIAGTVCAEGRC